MDTFTFTFTRYFPNGTEESISRKGADWGEAWDRTGWEYDEKIIAYTVSCPRWHGTIQHDDRGAVYTSQIPY